MIINNFHQSQPIFSPRLENMERWKAFIDNELNKRKRLYEPTYKRSDDRRNQPPGDKVVLREASRTLPESLWVSEGAELHLQSLPT